MPTKAFLEQPKQSQAPALVSQLHSAIQSQARAYLPEFVTLKPSGGDPITGMSRSWWYSAERDGLIRLHRIRRPGMVKARVLLPVPQALELIRRLNETAAAATA